MTITRTTLVTQVATRTGLSKADTENTIVTTVEVIIEALGQRLDVQVFGFGSFRVAHREASEGRNPKTGEKLHIAARDTVKFIPGKAIKNKLNPPAPTVPRRRTA